MIAPRKVYWRCCHPKFKFIILVPWLLPWIPQWLFPSNGFCHMIEPCIVPWVLPWNPLWVLLSNGFCHMNKPSLVAGKGWHFVRTFFVVGILSVPFFGLDFVRTISTCFGILSVGILSYHRWEKWFFLCSKQHGFQSFEKIMKMIHWILLKCESERLFLLCWHSFPKSVSISEALQGNGRQNAQNKQRNK